MKHFSDDGCNPQPDYDTSIVAGKYREEPKEEHSILYHEEDELPEDWYDTGIKHFED